ncbi:hypothetical protein EMCRGX_G022290 [Ephydatia muelleri]
MRNLDATICITLPANPALAGAQCFCLDSDSATLWVATATSLCRVSSDYQVSTLVDLVRTERLVAGDRVVGLEYESGADTVCLALLNGDVLTFNTHSHEVECVGSVSAGLEAMAWSPDQDLVVFVTGEQKLLLMTREFDPVTEVAMCPEEFGEAAPVNVGWGQKETQFHGSLGGKSTAILRYPVPGSGLPPPPPPINWRRGIRHPSSWDDRKARLTWRGDGEYFACSTFEPETGTRKIRVWTKECTLHSTSEEKEGLEQALNWKPSGNLMASTQRKPNRHDVIFFERNGLQHGEFTLHAGRLDLVVKEMQWNGDSTVLALWLEGMPTPHCDTPKPTTVQLWTTSNYHWYLKQELRLPPPSDGPTNPPPSLVGLAWDPVNPLRLHLLTTSGQYLVRQWRWTVSESTAHTKENMATVAVIDGANLLLTPFRTTVVPPPMCGHSVELSGSVSMVTFAPPPCCNDFIALLADGSVAMFGCVSLPRQGKEENGFRNVTSPPQLVATAKLAMDQGHTLRQLSWWKADRLLGLVSCDRSRDRVVEFSVGVVDSEKHTVDIVQCCATPCQLPVLCLYSNPDTHTVVAELSDGSVLKYTDGSLLPWETGGAQTLCYPVEPCDNISLASFAGQECVVGLNTRRRTLFVNDIKVASCCTSFSVHDEFLLLTTDSHTCRSLSLHTSYKALPSLTSDQPSLHDETIRRVERGSKIVTSVTHDMRLILQMPRGNLETVCPRALVLTNVRRWLDELNFGDAFVAMCKHRINLNLVYDHNPRLFLSHVKEFVSQLEIVNRINLFLTDLKEEDVTVTMYPGPGKMSASSDPKPASKVDTVCDAVRQALLELGEDRFLLSVITTMVKKTSPELEAVLEKISRLKALPPAANGVHLPTAEEALKYTLFLVDVNQLFDVALGMYDFDLVLMVAERSQKDPKEYLPFLNELRRLPLHYQRFRIDQHLKRYGKALVHLSQCGAERFEECVGFMCQHSLYREALDIFNDKGSPQYKTVASSYGDYLLEKALYKDAGIMYTLCGNLPKALAAFEKARMWSEVFVLSSKLGFGEADRIQLARRVAASLKDARRHGDAATVLLDYAKDVDECVDCLLQGSLWEEAQRIMYLHGRLGLVETHLKPSLVHTQQSLVALVMSMKETFSRHVARLEIVRVEKAKRQQAIEDGTYAADERDADLFSDTSSVTGQSVASSRASKASGRSSKNRRKTERKKRSLKEGSLYEDIALVEAVSELVCTADRMQDEVGSLLHLLAQYDCTALARSLQSEFAALMRVVRDGIPRVWKPAPSVVINSGDTKQPVAVEMEVQAPKVRELAWQLGMLG